MHHRGDWVWVAGVMVFPFAWFVAHFGGLVTSHHWTALVSGLGIFGAAFLLSWASS